MTTKLASALALTVLLAGCAAQQPATTAPVAQSDYRAEWMAAHYCAPSETYETCQSRVAATELRLHDETMAQRQADPEWQAEQARHQQADSVRRECLYEAKVATVNIGNDGTLFYGAINQAFQENRLFTECVQARAGY